PAPTTVIFPTMRLTLVHPIGSRATAPRPYAPGATPSPTRRESTDRVQDCQTAARARAARSAADLRQCPQPSRPRRASLDQVVAFRLDGQRAPDERLEGLTTPQRVPQVRLEVAEEARPELS